jgi:multimeric flavodoxin WrbA
MKEFFDRTYYDVLDRVAGRPYGLMVCAGSDGQGAVRQAARIATGWRLKPAAEPLVVITGAQTAEAISSPKTIGPDDLARAADLGQALAAGLALGIF